MTFFIVYFLLSISLCFDCVVASVVEDKAYRRYNECSIMLNIHKKRYFRILNAFETDTKIKVYFDILRIIDVFDIIF